jgi:hypothetical protein
MSRPIVVNHILVELHVALELGGDRWRASLKIAPAHSSTIARNEVGAVHDELRRREFKDV